VVGVGEHDVRTDLAKLIRCDALDGRARADRHEHRRGDRAMRRLEESGACRSGAVDSIE